MSKTAQLYVWKMSKTAQLYVWKMSKTAQLYVWKMSKFLIVVKKAMYDKRIIDQYLTEMAARESRKPILLRVWFSQQ